MVLSKLFALSAAGPKNISINELETIIFGDPRERRSKSCNGQCAPIDFRSGKPCSAIVLPFQSHKETAFQKIFKTFVDTDSAGRRKQCEGGMRTSVSNSESIGQARGGVGRWQTSAEGLGNVDEHSKKTKSNDKLIPLPGREVELHWLCVG